MDKFTENLTDAVLDGDGLALLPGGKLVRKASHFDDGQEIVAYEDVTTAAAGFFFDAVSIHKDFTVGDLFELFEVNAAIFSVIFSKDWFREFLEVYRNIKSGAITVIQRNDEGPLDRRPIEIVELYWLFSASQGECFLDREHRVEIETNVKKLRPRLSVQDSDGNDLEDIFADAARRRKEEIHRDLLDKTYWRKVKESYYLCGFEFPQCHILKKAPGGQRGKLEPFSMSFVALHELLPAKLRLSTTALLVRNDKEHGERGAKKEFSNPRFTLGHVIKDFLFELSWHGGPGETQETGELIKERLDSLLLTEGKADRESSVESREDDKGRE